MAVSSLAARRATGPVVVEADLDRSASPAGPLPGRAVQSAAGAGTAGRHGREDGGSAGGVVRAASSATTLAVASTLAAARNHRLQRGGLPPPATVAGGIAMALLEIEAGCRSVAQLERICSPALWSVLEQTVRRRGGPFAAGHALIRVHCQSHSAELADAVAVVRRGRRAQAIVIRLEASGGRWMVTVLEVLAHGGPGMRAARRGEG